VENDEWFVRNQNAGWAGSGMVTVFAKMHFAGYPYAKTRGFERIECRPNETSEEKSFLIVCLGD
jgi:hypothetical protein